MALTDLGRVCPVSRGAYNAATAYSRLDIITFEGSSYICKASGTGNSPINTVYWQLLAQGALGEAGIVAKQNILRNWDMREPLNQRAVSGTVSAVGYFYDEWLLNSGSVVVNANYLTVAGAAVIEHRIRGNLLAGAVVTVSIMAADTVYSNTGTFPISEGTASVTIPDWGTVTLGYASGYMYIRFSPTSASNVQAMKAELGTISTLAYDLPMDFWTQVLPYDIGDILITLNAASPAARFPGTTWAAISGKFLIGADGTYTADSDGGATTHIHSTSEMTLSVAQIPSHRHVGAYNYSGSFSGGGAYAFMLSTGNTDNGVVGYAGGSGAHGHGNTGSGGNLPPYKAVYMWERTA